MLEIMLLFELGGLTNAGHAYWVIFTLFCVVKTVKFFIWCFKND